MPIAPVSMPFRFKILVALLAVSNIATGAFAFFSLRSVDRKYSELVAGVVPALNDLQTLTALETEAMRQTNPSLIANAAPDAIANAREAITHQRSLRESLLA